MFNNVPSNANIEFWSNFEKLRPVIYRDMTVLIYFVKICVKNGNTVPQGVN
jgi:hypothetical protein